MGLFIPPDWQLPEEFTQRLGDAAGRQRAMAAEDQLLIVLHQPAGPADSGRKGRLFWRNPQGDWRSSSQGEGFQAVRKHVGEFVERIEALEKDCLAAQSADDYFELLRALAPLHRSARNLHATLQKARELTPNDRDLINARDQAGDVERAFELLHTDARNGLDFTIARQAELQARRAQDMSVAAYRLNVLAAVFLPLATLSAIFGMNLPHGLEVGNQSAYFWCVLGGGLVGGLLLAQTLAQQPASAAAPPRSRKRMERYSRKVDKETRNGVTTSR
jgi:hypothetical protein